MHAFGQADPVVVEAIRQAIAETAHASSRTIGFTLWRTQQILSHREGTAKVELPSRTTLYRLFDKLRLDDGVAEKVELTGMSTSPPDRSPQLCCGPPQRLRTPPRYWLRSVTPEAMRPGWAEALRLSRSGLPHRRLLSIDKRLEHAAARPVTVPETIVCDHGSVFILHAFRASCRHLGINLQAAHKATPTDKGTIEKTLGSVATLFAQFVAGYTGSTTDRRGRGLEGGPLWSLPELQNLLDEWIIAVWQTRPHDSLRDPDAPARAFSPNEKYATLLESCGYVPVPLSGEDYVELLPARWQAINAYGIRIKHRTYDSPELNPLRRQRSGVTTKKGLWEVHYDPYNVSRIWVRDSRTDRWITVFWKHLHRVGVPFGELAWDHARAQVLGGIEEQSRLRPQPCCGGPTNPSPLPLDQRQGGTLQPDSAGRVGLPPGLCQHYRTRRRTRALGPLLQHCPPTHCARQPATDHPTVTKVMTGYRATAARTSMASVPCARCGRAGGGRRVRCGSCPSRSRRPSAL
ncbi:integrase [Streptomyces griseorubiginosus]|uniref:Integrase n=1 Tax=Streptomyces griseorubiginosus TaxID=67304 RepID=A0A124HVR6_9ACTN|nr:integrase [Streptomyces griseorubiginosus]